MRFFMTNTGIYLIAFLTTISLLCGRIATLASAQEDHDHSVSSTEDDGVVRLSETSCETAGIEVVQAKPKQSRSVLKAMGKVLAPQPQTAIVGHAFSARVSEVHVKIGDWVEKGQALVTVESQEVGSAKSDFFKAIADLELAELNYDREKRLLESEIGIEKNFLAAEAQHKIAVANREAVEKRLHVIGFTEDAVKEIAEKHQISPSITLYAPIDGKIVKNNAVLGALIDQETEIMTIINPKMLWVDAQVYEKDIAKVKAGQKAEIRVPAYPGQIFHGRVSYIGDVVDEETRTITVRAEVSNDDQRLKPGMFADVDIVLNGDTETLVVPSAAILEEGYQEIVFVKHEDRFERREIETGVVDGECRQILNGLADGEEVVIQGNQLLRSKLKVDILRQAHHHGHGHGQGQQHRKRERRREP
jgi:cobalt-zinc-cadmium efflux system membrane fusion protein